MHLPTFTSFFQKKTQRRGGVGVGPNPPTFSQKTDTSGKSVHVLVYQVHIRIGPRIAFPFGLSGTFETAIMSPSRDLPVKSPFVVSGPFLPLPSSTYNSFKPGVLVQTSKNKLEGKSMRHYAHQRHPPSFQGSRGRRKGRVTHHMNTDATKVTGIQTARITGPKIHKSTQK